MANTQEHVFWGALAGVGSYVLAKRMQNQEVDWRNALGCGFTGAGVALLPDLLEPAVSPKHRKLAHSVTAAGLLLYSARKNWDSNNTNPEQKATWASLIAAYLSHLAVDSSTPAGLPLI